MERIVIVQRILAQNVVAPFIRAVWSDVQIVDLNAGLVDEDKILFARQGNRSGQESGSEDRCQAKHGASTNCLHCVDEDSFPIFIDRGTGKCERISTGIVTPVSANRAVHRSPAYAKSYNEPVVRPMTWNHNIHYHEVALAAVPSGCHNAVDVGCGRGDLARKLAPGCREVLALDVDSACLKNAQSAPNFTFQQGDIFTHPLEDESFDFITAVATLHRAASLQDYAFAAAAIPVSRIIRMARGEAEVGAPVQEPKETLEEIRRACNATLPGGEFRRRFLLPLLLRVEKTVIRVPRPTIHILAVNAALETQALRPAAEYWGASVSVTWAATSQDIMDLLANHPTHDLIIIAGHGDQRGLWGAKRDC